MGNWQATPPPPTEPMYGTPRVSGQLANVGQRLVAWIIDYVIVWVISAILYWIFSALHVPVVGYLLDILVFLAYFTYQWGRYSQTLGYRLMHIRLVGSGGAPAGYGLALVRAILIHLSFLFCAIPAIVSFIMIAATQRKSAIHDLILGQAVVAE